MTSYICEVNFLKNVFDFYLSTYYDVVLKKRTWTLLSPLFLCQVDTLMLENLLLCVLIEEVLLVQLSGLEVEAYCISSISSPR